jgi:hypothetical protein
MMDNRALAAHCYQLVNERYREVLVECAKRLYLIVDKQISKFDCGKLVYNQLKPHAVKFAAGLARRLYPKQNATEREKKNIIEQYIAEVPVLPVDYEKTPEFKAWSKSWALPSGASSESDESDDELSAGPLRGASAGGLALGLFNQGLSRSTDSTRTNRTNETRNTTTSTTRTR